MGLMTVFQEIYDKFAIAIIILLAGFIIAKIAGKIVKRILAEADINKILAKTKLTPMSDALGGIVEYALYLATIIVVLQQFGLANITLWIIGTIAIVVIIFSLTLAIRDFIPNAIAGLFIKKRLNANLGKQVKIGMISGRLEHVGIVASTIRNSDEQYVPHLYTSKYI